MKKNILFIATPISGFENPKEYNIFRNKLLSAIKKLSRLEKVEKIICESQNVKTVSDYDSPYLSAQNDFRHISQSSHFILLYPQKAITGALIELGFAIALKKKILIIAPTPDVLPYMAQELDKVYSNIQNIFAPYETIDIYEIIKHFITE